MALWSGQLCVLYADGDAGCTAAANSSYGGSFPGPYTQIAAGQLAKGYAFCGIRKDGSVDINGATPAGAQGTYTQISCGYSACALRADGTLQCWGDHALHAPAGKFTDVSVSSKAACALRTSGVITCWQATSDAVDVPIPGKMVSIIGVVSISGVCGLASDGTVGCWGTVYSSPLPGTFLQVSGWPDDGTDGAGTLCGITSDTGELRCSGAYAAVLLQRKPADFP
jgi:hypothetical protein